MKEERINEIWAVLLLALGVIAFISLISFDPQDLSFYTSNPNTPINNFAGVVGAYLAGALAFAIGKAGFVIPIVLLLWSIARFTGNIPQKFYLKVLGGVILITMVSSLFSIIYRYDSVARFSSGGIVGLGVSSLLMRYFGIIGSYVIITSLIVLSLILATEFLLSPLLYSLYIKVKSLKISLPERRARRTKAITKPKPALKPVVSQAAVKATPKPQEPKKKSLRPEKTVIPYKPPQRETPKKKPVLSSQRLESGTKEEVNPYTLPQLDLLSSPPPISERSMKEDFDTSAHTLEETLSDFGLEVKVVKIEQGPVITRYELEPAPGIKVSRIASLGDNIALAMKAQSVRIVAPIPGKGTIGVEVPNTKSAMVYLREVLETKSYQDAASSKLAMALGKDISGHAVIADLSDMPHLLIAGATGSGKTVCVNSIIASILFNATPDEVKFLMVDPKMVELSIYNNIPHLLCPVVTDHKKVSAALNWIVSEMESRYKLLAGVAARNIDIYNAKMEKQGSSKIPYIIVIIDELADLMVVAAQDIENAITRLAQLSRAVGIHIILATQRPSVDVITGVIKANFPSRISFKVASKVDSRTVLDMNGADKLLGKGDMLYVEPGNSKPIRAQGSLVSDAEIERIVKFIKNQRTPEYNIDIVQEEKKAKFKTFEKDEVYDEAVKVVMTTKQASVSMLQRRLGLGYTRAARLIDTMEDEGIVGPYAGSKPREILISEIKEEAREEEAEPV